MSDDLKARLRACANGIGNFKSNQGDYGICDDAADRIEALEAEAIAAWNIRALPAVAASQPANPAVKVDSCQPVRVKPLEWNQSGRNCIRAETSTDTYEILDGWVNGKFLLRSRHSDEWRDTLIAAKAAAQADYEARILAAIEIQPDPRDAAVIMQLVEAAEAQLQYMDMCGDKGDLERNLRSSLFAVKGLKNE